MAFNNINTQYYMNPGPVITNTTVFGARGSTPPTSTLADGAAG
jgi:hypothetical protein